MEEVEKPKLNERFVKVTYHSEGNVEQTGNVNVFDLWGVGRLLLRDSEPIASASDHYDDEEKFLKVEFSPDKLAVTANRMSVLDVLALSRYLELYADEMYISKKVADRTGKNAQVQLVGPQSMSRSERRRLERESKAN